MENMRRYGPLGLIVVLLVMVGAVVAFKGDDPSSGGDRAKTGATDQALGIGRKPGAPKPVGRMPRTYAEAKAAGQADADDWGDRCDPATGKVKLPTVYATPCVPVFRGDNGGATTSGVTKDTITVVRYVAEASVSLDASLAGVVTSDTPEQGRRTLQTYLDLYASRAELYGRKIKLVDYKGTGSAEDVVAAKADATQIATELKPFFVIGGPGQDRGTFAQELTAHGIVCLDCSGSVSAKIADAMAPRLWGSYGSQFLVTLGAWINQVDTSLTAAQRREAQKATFAGDPAFRHRKRKVGVIHYDLDPPVFKVAKKDYPKGVSVIDSYVLNFNTLPQKAIELAAKFKDEGITTIAFMGDPIMPMYLTKAATDQGWFPEWVFTGTYLTDTNLMARQYDQRQMAHAFGISQLAAPTDRSLGDALRLYRWWEGDPKAEPPAKVYFAALAGSARFLVAGLSMAGPDLTAETFARGQFRIPPAGGGPTTPQISYGNWGFFKGVDYSGMDDSSEIWWDPNVSAPDESGKAGRGVWRRAHHGLRFINESDAPTPDPFADPGDTITVVHKLTAEDTPPSYPPPPGSPADGGGAR